MNCRGHVKGKIPVNTRGEKGKDGNLDGDIGVAALCSAEDMGIHSFWWKMQHAERRNDLQSHWLTL